MAVMLPLLVVARRRVPEPWTRAFWPAVGLALVDTGLRFVRINGVVYAVKEVEERGSHKEYERYDFYLNKKSL